jgi:hypothetical protein
MNAGMFLVEVLENLFTNVAAVFAVGVHSNEQISIQRHLACFSKYNCHRVLSPPNVAEEINHLSWAKDSRRENHLRGIRINGGVSILLGCWRTGMTLAVVVSGHSLQVFAQSL